MFWTQSILKPTGVNHTSELFHLAFTSIMIYFSYPHSFNFIIFQEYNFQIVFIPPQLLKIFSATGAELSITHKVLASRLAS